ncbi:ER membrane protein complex subunit 10 [Geodia barretti]|uniref:ER membrane protein complex subunit 10 n=1 Tax=Geodia barretti TaxID=519541 RepID=A0AA35QZ52_GEOBA|nr:ER membrane protein complex subunit 10 [Geodia barretti]
MWWWWLAASLYFLVLSCSYGNAAKHSKDSGRDGAESLTLVLQHAIGDGEFSERGVASVRSLKSSTTAMSLSQNPLSHAQLDEIKSAAVSGELYRLRTLSRLKEGLTEDEESNSPGRQFVSTTISACSLVKSHLSDLIKVTGDGRGNVIGLTITTLPQPYEVDCTNPEVTLPRSFNTTVTLDNGSPPPAPDVHNYLQKEEMEERAKREGKDDRSFFQKYWMYILIGAFLLITLNAGQAAAGGGGGG